jgi:hypothetical protein
VAPGAGPFADFPSAALAFQMSGAIYGNDASANQFRVTGGQGLLMTASNWYDSAPKTGLRIGVAFPAQGAQTSENSFSVWMSTPAGQPLKVGHRYDNATRAPFAQAGPGVDISGNGQGNNTLKGSFEITRLEYHPNGSPRTVEGWAQQIGEGGKYPCIVQFRIVNQAPAATP